MKYGFIRAMAVAPSVKPGDCAFNASQILAAITEAERAGAHLLVLPELCVTGYTCGDLFLQETLLRDARDALADILRQSAGSDVLTVVGLPLAHAGKLYNCAAVLHGGRLLGVVPKSHMPTYGEYHESRLFTAAPPENGLISLDGDVPFGTKLLFQCTNQPDFCLAAEICEDMWVQCPPSTAHAAAGATVIACLSGAAEHLGEPDTRRLLTAAQSARSICAYVYANAGEGESTTDTVFAGHALIAENGVILHENEPFSGRAALCDVDVSRLAFERRRITSFPALAVAGYQTVPFSVRRADAQPLSRPVSALPFVTPEHRPDDPTDYRSVLALQCAGLRKRLEHLGRPPVVIGVSGGLDSTLTLLVTARTFDALDLPRTGIQAVSLPCFGTSGRTQANADALCRALGVTHSVIDIADSVRRHLADIGHGGAHDVTFENAQARERTQVLMDLANQSGGLLVGTGDLSEIALGWSTYAGDHISMYNVNAGVPKTLLRHVVRGIAQDDETLRAVLTDILDTPVSAELLPAENGVITQRTEEILGPYELHDFFLYYGVRWGFSPEKILFLAQHAFADRYDRASIVSCLRLFFRRFFAQQFKRSCSPDGPAIGPVSLSPRGGFMMPSDVSAGAWQRELDRL